MSWRTGKANLVLGAVTTFQVPYNEPAFLASCFFTFQSSRRKTSCPLVAALQGRRLHMLAFVDEENIAQHG